MAVFKRLQDFETDEVKIVLEGWHGVRSRGDPVEVRHGWEQGVEETEEGNGLRVLASACLLLRCIIVGRDRNQL